MVLRRKAKRKLEPGKRIKSICTTEDTEITEAKTKIF